jgi:hypothetical protein
MQSNNVVNANTSIKEVFMKIGKIKKAAVIGMCCTIISTSTVFGISNNLNANNDIKIQINNEWQLELNPYIENGRTLVSLNELVDELGAQSEIDLNNGAIKIIADEVILEMQVGKSIGKIIVNDGGSLVEESVDLEASPKQDAGKFFVPLRFVAETLGYNVQWDNYLRAVIIEEVGDIISVERPVKFEIVDRQIIEDNALLANLYLENYMTKGTHSLIDGDYIYVLISAGERPTGGYSIEVNSITEVTPGTAYIHAHLHAPEEGSMVIQVLTYPSVMVRFEKNGILNIQWDLTGDVDSAEAEENEIVKFVQEFGGQLKMVSLLAPEDILKETMNEYYGSFVSAELIEKWIKDPVTAPGRLTSSPWPGRIDVLSVEKIAEDEYLVKGNIVEFTSVEMEEGGIAAKREITLNIKKINDKWMIVDAELGDY